MPFLSSKLLLRTYSLALLSCAYYLLTAPTQLLSSSPIWLLGESMSVRPAGYAPEMMSRHGAAGGGGSSSSSTNLKRGLMAGSGLAQAQGEGPAERELFALLGLVVLVYAATQFFFAGDLSMIKGTRPTAAAAASSSSSSSAARHGFSSAAKSSSRYAEELHTLLTAQSRWLTLSALHVLASSTLVFWIYMFHSHSSPEPQSSTGSAESGTSLLSGLNLLANRVVFTVGLADMLFWGYLWTVLKDEGRDVAKFVAMRREAEDDDE
ncbi:hypothetical protein AYL99_10767 [Fonsecaea erecta]|uniref:Uncharacterized protein n=1 Tax=Fonsecaea erecta TaxID=1367422 RepID=A0A178Z5N6_9EURO|nr:hypothetical protein AYL99_10767 [Fonsecaea erecta]OAP55067.1 hypothetical protein AYL99_10767 [Fonsecaea erecta]